MGRKDRRWKLKKKNYREDTMFNDLNETIVDGVRQTDFEG